VVKTGVNKLPEVGGGAVDIYSTAPFETWNSIRKREQKKERKKEE
jgi:hypothetical protein